MSSDSGDRGWCVDGAGSGAGAGADADAMICQGYREVVEVMNEGNGRCLRDSIVVSISACHVEDPGSIPGRGASLFPLIPRLFTSSSALPTLHTLTHSPLGRLVFSPLLRSILLLPPIYQ